MAGKVGERSDEHNNWANQKSAGDRRVCLCRNARQASPSRYLPQQDGAGKCGPQKVRKRKEISKSPTEQEHMMRWDPEDLRGFELTIFEA